MMPILTPKNCNYTSISVSRRYLPSILSKNLSTVSDSDRPWLSYFGNPLMKWEWPLNLPPNPSPDSTKASFSFNNENAINQSNDFNDGDEENLLTTICRIVRKNDDDLEGALDRSGIRIYPELMEKVLERAEYSWKPIFRCFSWAERQSGFKHTSLACNLMINIMTKMREFDSAWVLVGHMKEQGLITSETFTILMRRYARAGMPKAALRTFDLMEYFGCKSDSDAFNVLLGTLCKEGKVHPATVFFQQRRSKLAPCTVTYNILINGWCRLRRIAKAEKLLEHMVSHGIPPSVVTYTTLIDGYCRTRRVEDGLKLLDSMKLKGCEPNVITYNSIVDALGEARRSQEALTILDKMGANGCTPNISTYNSLIKGLCKQEDLPGASKILKMMMERGCLPTATTYNYFFRFFSKYGKIKEGMNLYTKMIDFGYVPDRLTYQLLLKMLCEKGRVELAVQVKKDMDARGCDSDLATCTMLIHRLCRLSKLDEACSHFETMVQKGISPQYVTYEMLVDGLRKSDRSDKAQMLSEMMAVTPHSKRLPNTYRSDDAQKRLDSIVDNTQRISKRLITKRDSKRLHREDKPNTEQKSPECIVETARQFTEKIKARVHITRTGGRSSLQAELPC